MNLTNVGATQVPERLEASATIVLLRDGPQGMEVFLMKRAAEAAVLGGVHVFPGGKVDAADRDHAAPLDRETADLHSALAEAELPASEARAIHVAALRELQEECGVVLFASQIAPWSRWITPVIPGVQRRRFDTRFFVAVMPQDQTARVTDRESTLGVWLGPRTALEMYWRGEIDLAPPQITTLAHLARHPDARTAFEAASRTPPRLVQPHVVDVDGQKIFCYPGDALHPVGERAFPGVSRLLLRAGRFEPLAGFDGFFD